MRCVWWFKIIFDWTLQIIVMYQLNHTFCGIFPLWLKLFISNENEIGLVLTNCNRLNHKSIYWIKLFMNFALFFRKKNRIAENVCFFLFKFHLVVYENVGMLYLIEDSIVRYSFNFDCQINLDTWEKKLDNERFRKDSILQILTMYKNESPSNKTPLVFQNLFDFRTLRTISISKLMYPISFPPCSYKRFSHYDRKFYCKHFVKLKLYIYTNKTIEHYI